MLLKSVQISFVGVILTSYRPTPKLLIALYKTMQSVIVYILCHFNCNCNSHTIFKFYSAANIRNKFKKVKSDLILGIYH